MKGLIEMNKTKTGKPNPENRSYRALTNAYGGCDDEYKALDLGDTSAVTCNMMRYDKYNGGEVGRELIRFPSAVYIREVVAVRWICGLVHSSAVRWHVKNL